MFTKGSQTIIIILINFNSIPFWIKQIAVLLQLLPHFRVVYCTLLVIIFCSERFTNQINFSIALIKIKL
jgi:hypothetical protein